MQECACARGGAMCGVCYADEDASNDDNEPVMLWLLLMSGVEVGRRRNEIQRRVKRLTVNEGRAC